MRIEAAVCENAPAAETHEARDLARRARRLARPPTHAVPQCPRPFSGIGLDCMHDKGWCGHKIRSFTPPSTPPHPSRHGRLGFGPPKSSHPVVFPIHPDHPPFWFGFGLVANRGRPGPAMAPCICGDHAHVCLPVCHFCDNTRILCHSLSSCGVAGQHQQSAQKNLAVFFVSCFFYSSEPCISLV